MEQFMIMRQTDDGFSVLGPLDRKEVEDFLASANVEGETLFTEMPEMMGGEMVDQGFCVLKIEVLSPKPVQVVTKYEF